MALVDADYRFIYMDISDYGSQSDGAVFKKSHVGQAFVSRELDIPDYPNYPEGGVLPYYSAGNEAFPCRMDSMQPYPRGTSGVRLPLPSPKNFQLQIELCTQNCGECIWQIGPEMVNLQQENAIVTRKC